MTCFWRFTHLLLATLIVASALAAAEPDAGVPEVLGQTSYPKERVAFRGHLYFVASSRTQTAGLWRADEAARAAVSFRELGIELPGAVTGLAATNDAVLFGLRTEEALELWRTDGTVGGTGRVVALAAPGTTYEPTSIRPMIVSGGRCYFIVVAKGLATHWASDGTATGTVALRSESAGIPDLVPFGRGVIFTAFRKGMLLLSVSEGTVASTQSLHGVECESAGTLSVAADRAWIMCRSRYGTRLYSTDGTAGGLRFTTLPTSSSSPVMARLLPVAGGVTFLFEELHGTNTLWFSDGTPEGTATLFFPSDFVQPEAIGAFGEGVVFSLSGSHASLWFSDGTRSGTRPFYPGELPASAGVPSLFFAAGERLFFVMSTAETGSELWVTDGTASGTHIVLDIFPGIQGAFGYPWLLSDFSEFGGLLIFVADDGEHGRELWRSDGTPGGTWLVANAYEEGAISGRVVDESDGRPIADALIEIYDSNKAGSVPVQRARTAADGTYSASGLGCCNYFYVRATSFSGHLSEAWPDAPSVDGDLAGATPVKVRVSETTPSIDFALRKGGTVRGTVRMAGEAGLAGIGIRVFNGAGLVVSTGSSRADGSYETGSGLPPGSYFVAATDTSNYTDQLFDALPCGVGCDPLKGTAVIIDGPAGRSKVDFLLGVRPSIQGTVVDSFSRGPVVNALIDARAAGKSLATTRTDAAGNFQLRAPEGDVYLVTSAKRYLSQLYPGLDCDPGCPSGGTALQLSAGTELEGIDFSLLRGGMTLTGLVTDAVTKLPLPGIRVEAIDWNWVTQGFATTDESGRYEIRTATYPASLYLIVRPDFPYAAAIQGGGSCSGRCVLERGTRFVVKAGNVATGADFLLERGGVAMSGTVVDRQTGFAVAGAEVEIYDRLGAPVRTWAYPLSSKLLTDNAGRYDSGPLLAPGNHFVQITRAAGFVRELHSGLPACDPKPTCPTSDGTPVVVTGSAGSVVNFQLTRMGRVSGRVYDRKTGKGLPDATVRLCTQSFFKRCHTDTYTDVNGHYESVGIPDGSYTVTASRSSHLGKRYGGPICGECGDEDGLSFAIAPGKHYADVDFALEQPATMSGRVFDAATGKPVRAARLTIYSPEFGFENAVSDANGEYRAAGLLEGTYFVAASEAGYTTSFHANRACTTSFCGDRDFGNSVPVRFGMNTPHVDIPMFTKGTLRIAVVDKATDSALANASVTIYGNSDSPWLSTQTDVAGIVSYSLPPGAYQILVKPDGNTNSFIYPGVVRWAKDLFSGTAVVVDPGKTTDVRFEIESVRIEAVIPPAAVTGATPKQIEVRGSGFAAGAAQPKVTFGGKEGAVQSVSSTQIKVIPPAGLSGAVDLVVTNSNGVSGTAPFKFQFIPTCVPPSISFRNSVIAVARGDWATLEVTITAGTPPFHVSWGQILTERSHYELSGTKETFAVRPFETTSYGVRVESACGGTGWPVDPKIRVDIVDPPSLTSPVELTRRRGARP